MPRPSASATTPEIALRCHSLVLVLVALFLLQRRSPSMRANLSTLFATVIIPFLSAHTANAASSYANQFVDPDAFLAGGWNESMVASQNTIISWARELSAQGPWSQLFLFQSVMSINC